MAGQRRQGARTQLRVIGGQWRGSRLEIGDNPALRPTADRIRETLFNWLAGRIANARCLDLFAGSGALGIEALSRGAAHCDFVESDPHTAGLIETQLGRLGAGDTGSVHTGDALSLAPPKAPWDIVFIDPPFAAELTAPVLEQLRAPGFLAEDADIYVETARDDLAMDHGFDGFEIWRDKCAGEVRYGLLQRL